MKYFAVIIILITTCCKGLNAQCFSSVNPVGGISNLLVLEKNTMKYIGLYHYGLKNEYYEGHRKSDYSLVKKADYNYLGAILAYGIFDKVTFEAETGYFINKTYEFENSTSEGYGFSNIIISSKIGLITNYEKRFYSSVSAGVKIPFTRKLQKVDGVEVPHELQPSTHAFGYVLQGFVVKENSYKGLRYFLIARGEYNYVNQAGYKYADYLSVSAYFSKHLMYNRIKDDWTVIMQIRNEFRGADKMDNIIVESTGGYLLLAVPQINYSIKEKWNISLMGTLPVYQYFKGTQLATKFGIILNFSGDLKI